MKPLSRRVISRWSLLIAALCLGGFAFLRAFQGPLVPAVKPQRGAVIQKVVASGQIIPHTRVRMIAQVTGTIAQVMVEEGATVKAGQLLIEVAHEEVTAQVEQAQAAYELAQAKADQFQGVNARLTREALRQAEVKLEKARLDVRREEELARVRASTQEALDRARSDFQLAESQYQSAMAQAKAVTPQGSDSRMAWAAVEQSHGVLAAAEARLAQYRITAPLDAKVLQRSVEPGDGVQPGTLLLTLASVDAPRARVQVDEKYLALISEGQAAHVTADAFPGRSFEGKVERLAPSVNQERGSIEVDVILTETPPFLRYDMSASVEIITNSAAGALLLPLEAVQAAATAQPFVYAAVQGKVVKRDVTLGLRGDTLIEVTGGVDADSVVLIPSAALEPGTRVRAAVKGWNDAV